MRLCPLCKEPLYDGQQICTRVFNGADKSKNLVHMYGCSHCFPHNELYTRHCLKCSSSFSDDDYMLATMIINENAKALYNYHLQVYGCTICNPHHKKEMYDKGLHTLAEFQK